MITGTNNFYDKYSAYNYYRAYGFDKTAVDGKLARGEIKTGHPEVKEGERVFLNTSEMRYFVESK
jgi:hypothetical protein